MSLWTKEISEDDDSDFSIDFIKFVNELIIEK